MIEIKQYIDSGGQNPFRAWFDRLDEQATAKITVAITRLSLGHASNIKGVGAGVFELKIDFGPGYRVYFGRDGETVVILVGGGTKSRQNVDIERSKSRWADYKKRKKGG